MASIAFSFISTFFMPSQLSVIQENFAVIEHKLDMINDKLDSVMANDKYNTWITTYITWEFAIRNGQQKLDDLILQSKDLNEGQEIYKMKLQQAYIDYYEHNDIEGAIHNIHRVTGMSSTATTEHLYDMFIKAKTCNVMALAELNIIINNIMISGIKQTFIYKFLKWGSVDIAEETFEKLSIYVYDIRGHFDRCAWKCYRDAINDVKTLTGRKAGEKVDKAERLTVPLSYELETQYPQYDWSVIAISKPNCLPNIHIICKPSYFWTGYRRVPADGKTWYVVSQDDSRGSHELMIVWQEAQDAYTRCDAAQDAHTLVSVQRPYFSESDFIISDNMVTNNILCTTQIQRRIKQETIKYDCDTLTILAKSVVIAAQFTSAENPCSDHAICSYHGTCHHIPYTQRKYCICDNFYDGDSCERHEPAAMKKFDSLIAIMRLNYLKLRGVPTVIDVFYHLLRLSDTIADITKTIIDSIKYNNQLSVYGETFLDAEYIAECYSDLISDRIDDRLFAYRLRHKNMHNVQFNMEKAILGISLLVDIDLLTAFKKMASGKCSDDYNTRLDSLRDGLLKLDESVSEARLKLKLMNSTNELMMSGTVDQIVQETKQRQMSYVQLWNQASCPELHFPDLQCGPQDSYVSLTIPVSCPQHKRPIQPTVQCERQHNEGLQWTPHDSPGM